MDQAREVLRLKHYSIRTERCYCDWIRRYIRFHKMRSREDLVPGQAKIELFLSDLAVNGHVAASTQNQAFNGLLFLYTQVLHQQLSWQHQPSPSPCCTKLNSQFSLFSDSLLDQLMLPSLPQKHKSLLLN